MTQPPLASKVTRVSIRTELGKYEFWADEWEPIIEDDGRTLKLYARGEGHKARKDREKELSQSSQQGFEYQKRMHEMKMAEGEK